MGHSSPEITAQTYDHSGVEDFREQFDRALSFGVGQPVHADAMQSDGESKEEAPGPDAFACDSEGFKSGRQDLNLRPLGPESGAALLHASAGIAYDGSACIRGTPERSRLAPGRADRTSSAGRDCKTTAGFHSMWSSPSNDALA